MPRKYNTTEIVPAAAGRMRNMTIGVNLPTGSLGIVNYLQYSFSGFISEETSVFKGYRDAS